jgi:hypothetical protein
MKFAYRDCEPLFITAAQTVGDQPKASDQLHTECPADCWTIITVTRLTAHGSK